MLLTLDVRFHVFGCAFHLLVKTFKFLRLVTEFCWVLRHSCSLSKLHCGVQLANSVLVQCLYVARSWRKIPSIWGAWYIRILGTQSTSRWFVHQLHFHYLFVQGYVAICMENLQFWWTALPCITGKASISFAGSRSIAFSCASYVVVSHYRRVIWCNACTLPLR